MIENEMETIVAFTCALSGAEGVLNYQRGYPALVNHAEETAFVAELAKEVPGVKEVTESPKIMGGEDFSYYLQHVKVHFSLQVLRLPASRRIRIIIRNLILMKEDCLLQLRYWVPRC